MGFKTLATLDFDGEATPLGGTNKSTGKANPKSIEGYYIGCKVVDSGKFGPSKLHVFQTKEGNKGVWGKTNLDNQLAMVIEGTMVRATFTGTVPSNKGNDMLKYKVEVDRDNRIDVAATSSVEENNSDGPAHDDTEETPIDSEESPDEVVPEPVRRPAKAATPNASKAAALLSGRRTG